MNYKLELRLKTDTIFGRGDGVAGLVDAEVEHDSATGLPFLRGRTLKGLLVEECANILYALGNERGKLFVQAGQFLFGRAGSTLADDALMHVGPAQLPEQLRLAVLDNVKAKKITTSAVLDLITTIRRQTSIDECTGSPESNSLRTMRVILRDTTFVALLEFGEPPNDEAKALLAACALALRGAGTGRNRGRGRLEARLKDDTGTDCTEKWFAHFQTLVNGVPA